MAKFTIYSSDGTVRQSGNPQFNGSYMGVDYLEFRNMSSPTPINWERGDFVDYYRTGLRYKLYTTPLPNKVARSGEYGGSFEYSNVQFHAATKELEIAPFRDLAPIDNRIHFSTRPDVSTYEDVYGIARRIQECMNDLYPGRWRIEVVDTEDESLLALLKEVKEYSVSGGSCLDALSQIYEIWKNVGWVHSYDSANDVDVITIGRANVRDAENTSDVFAYGKGNGLTSIKKAAANEGEFATRLYVYGSDRNIPPRYYNSKEIVDKDSVDIRNLMIPLENWGRTDGLPDARKAFLQADAAIVAKYGLIPRTVYFDGNEREEIFPSIEGLTEKEVRQAMIDDGRESDHYLPGNSETRIDEVLYATTPDDYGNISNADGTVRTDTLDTAFTLEIHNIGFDISKQAALANESNAVISMKSGKCAGREFPIKSVRWDGGTWVLKMERQLDDSLNMLFPNNDYMISEGDRFVLLDIAMPQFYITLNAKTLLAEGEKLLADYTRVSAYYEPGINPIKMKDDGKPLYAGMYMQVYDEDVIDTESKTDYVLIDSLTIDEAAELPQYKVTLREEKRAARTYSALEGMIEDAKQVTKDDIKQVKQYTERRFRSSQETLSMLQGAFKNFSEGINPVTVQTMAMLVGDESLQFKFISYIGTSETSINIGLAYNKETKTLKVSRQSRLMHMTLGIDSITAPSSRDFNDYKKWMMPAWESGVLDKAEKGYYFYARVPRDGTSGEFLLSETSISMNDESGYYHLLIGILNTEYAGTREFVSLYGFTEILPGRITTDKIVSADGNAVLDLVEGLLTFSGKVGLSASEVTEENLRIWAGSEKNANEDAPFRVYDSGKAFASLLHLLNGCTIGNAIRIEDGKMVIDLPDNNAKVTISEDGVMAEGYCTAAIGHCGGAGVQGFANGVPLNCPVSPDGKGVGVEGEAQNGGYAFFSASGMFAGLRPKTRVITTSGAADARDELSELDFSVLAYLSSGTCYLKLPNTPQDGQEYHIESHGASLNLMASNPTWVSKSKSVVYAGTPFTYDGSGILRLKYYKHINQWQCAEL